MLNHIVQGYTGTLGAYVLGAGNIVARQFTDVGETPALRLDELPVIKSFLRGADPTNYPVCRRFLSHDEPGQPD